MVHSIAYSKISKEELIFLSRYPKPILEKLVLKKIISKEEIENFIGLFKHFNISIESYYPENYLNEFKNNFFPEGYFQVVISNYPVRNNLFIDEIQKEFKIKRMNNEHGIDISLNQFCQFIYKYNVSKEITWYDVCCHPNIPWTNELIIKYRNVWYWETLHRNSSIIWNFELIEKAVDYLNWAFISSYEYLIWDTLSLTKYKDYIIFSIDPDKKWKRGYNKKGKKYSIYGPGESFNDNIHSNLKGSLSLSESIDWSKEIIDCVLDYWDWEELASNKSIAWDEEMIEYYSKKLDFKSLSSNPSVKWNERLIEKYKSKWDWKNLSGNLSLPWSYEFIERYEQKWQWKLKNYYNNISDESNFQPSISTNPSIMWNIKMLSKWERRLDFWRIARRGNLQDKALKRFYHKFDRKELVGWTFHKCSDFRADEKIYRSGWENFSLNMNFNINMENVRFLYKNKISLTYSVGNIASDGYYETKNFRLLEVLKNSIVNNISLSTLIENENKWGKVLINENFVNDSICGNLIEPLFKNKLSVNYLMLLEKINLLV